MLRPALVSRGHRNRTDSPAPQKRSIAASFKRVPTLPPRIISRRVAEQTWKGA